MQVLPFVPSLEFYLRNWFLTVGKGSSIILTVFNCTALEEDPVKIYNWVRNTIEFIPSYGSIQGADYTLQHGKGNAFDTASLLSPC